MIVVLDSGVLGRFCAPELDRELDTWMSGLLHRGRRVVVPEICDYEIRREMIRNRSKAIGLLDEFETLFDYLPITTAAMRRASELWARLRVEGKPTASDASLDADCVLAARHPRRRRRLHREAGLGGVGDGLGVGGLHGDHQERTQRHRRLDRMLVGHLELTASRALCDESGSAQ